MKIRGLVLLTALLVISQQCTANKDTGLTRLFIDEEGNPLSGISLRINSPVNNPYEPYKTGKAIDFEAFVEGPDRDNFDLLWNVSIIADGKSEKVVHTFQQRCHKNNFSDAWRFNEGGGYVANFTVEAYEKNSMSYGCDKPERKMKRGSVELNVPFKVNGDTETKIKVEPKQPIVFCLQTVLEDYPYQLDVSYEDHTKSFDIKIRSTLLENIKQTDFAITHNWNYSDEGTFIGHMYSIDKSQARFYPFVEGEFTFEATLYFNTGDKISLCTTSKTPGNLNTAKAKFVRHIVDASNGRLAVKFDVDTSDNPSYFLTGARIRGIDLKVCNSKTAACEKYSKDFDDFERLFVDLPPWIAGEFNVNSIIKFEGSTNGPGSLLYNFRFEAVDEAATQDPSYSSCSDKVEGYRLCIGERSDGKYDLVVSHNSEQKPKNIHVSWQMGVDYEIRYDGLVYLLEPTSSDKAELTPFKSGRYFIAASISYTKTDGTRENTSLSIKNVFLSSVPNYQTDIIKYGFDPSPPIAGGKYENKISFSVRDDFLKKDKKLSHIGFVAHYNDCDESPNRICSYFGDGKISSRTTGLSSFKLEYIGKHTSEVLFVFEQAQTDNEKTALPAVELMYGLKFESVGAYQGSYEFFE